MKKRIQDLKGKLDEIAAQLASALSDREIAGTAVTAGAATGFARAGKVHDNRAPIHGHAMQRRNGRLSDFC